MISEAQEARVPEESAYIEATIETATRLANKAKELYKVVPVDPHRDPSALSTHRNVVQALAADVEGQPA